MMSKCTVNKIRPMLSDAVFKSYCPCAKLEFGIGMVLLISANMFKSVIDSCRPCILEKLEVT